MFPLIDIHHHLIERERERERETVNDRGEKFRPSMYH